MLPLVRQARTRRLTSLVAASAALLVSLEACGGGSTGTKTAALTSSTPTTAAPVVFDVTVTDYVLRFNSLHRPILAVAGTVVDAMTTAAAGSGLFGNNVSSSNGVFLVANNRGDKVRAAVVTAPLVGTSISTPARLLADACANLLDTDRSLKVPDAFTRDALPKLGNMTASTVISVGGFFDIRLVSNGGTAGFACVPPGAVVPAAASTIPP